MTAIELAAEIKRFAHEMGLAKEDLVTATQKFKALQEGLNSLLSMRHDVPPQVQAKLKRLMRAGK